MAITTFTNQGNIAIPLEIQQYLNLVPDCKVELIIDQYGEVKLIPLNVDVKSLCGILYRKEQEPVSIEEMNQAIQERADASFGY
jgi:bifunctional DNA-binding transcriptional regulator/antitoxin component of YhaV-PrlF toxin-antitoxin module